MNSLTMKVSWALMMAVALCASASRAGPMMDSQAQSGRELSGVWHASQLIGCEVRGDQGQKLGKVDDIVLYPNGEISYAILGYGGFVGLGKTQVAVPLPAFRTDLSGRTLFLDISQETLRNAPAHVAEQARLDDPQWRDSLQSFYAKESVEFKRWSEMNASRMRREMTEAAVEGARGEEALYASKVIGTAVQNPETETVGKVQDLVLDVAQGKAAYALIRIDDIRDANGKLAAVPWGAMDIHSGEKVATVNADKTTLAMIAFEPDAMPNLASRAYAEKIYGEFHEQPYWTVYGFSGEEEEAPAPSQRMKRQMEEREYPTGQESNPW